MRIMFHDKFNTWLVEVTQCTFRTDCTFGYPQLIFTGVGYINVKDFEEAKQLMEELLKTGFLNLMDRKFYYFD